MQQTTTWKFSEFSGNDQFPTRPQFLDPGVRSEIGWVAGALLTAYALCGAKSLRMCFHAIWNFSDLKQWQRRQQQERDKHKVKWGETLALHMRYISGTFFTTLCMVLTWNDQMKGFAVNVSTWRWMFLSGSSWNWPPFLWILQIQRVGINASLAFKRRLSWCCWCGCLSACYGKRFYLLQESNQLTCSPLVRFGQVKILQIQHQSLAVLWSVHSASVRAYHHARLLELLKNVHGRGLGTTMYHSDLRRAELLKTVPQKEPKVIKCQDH